MDRHGALAALAAACNSLTEHWKEIGAAMRKQLRHLITGGAGFLGSHLCDRLLAAGDSVIVLDNFFTGHRRNLFDHEDDPLFELVRGDVCDPFHCEVDRIWHLACPASPVHYQRNPARTIETAVLGTRHALRLARAVGARVLIASTSEVYGDPLEHPQTESYWGNVNPIGPRANYDEGKRCGEALASAWAQQYGVDVRIARIFNTYGPRMAPDDGRVVSNFICQALRREPITIYGSGNQTRSFGYVSDIVAGLVRLMAAAGPDVDARPVNIGNPGEFTIAELADVVGKEVGGTVAIEYLPLPKDDPTRRRPDISLAERALGWTPEVSLFEGVHYTAEYFRGLLADA